jgi:hypothetical protein
VEERLLLHRIYMNGAGKAIDHAPQAAIQVDPDPAIPGLAWGHDTLLGTQQALHVGHDSLSFFWNTDTYLTADKTIVVDPVLNRQSAGYVLLEGMKRYEHKQVGRCAIHNAPCLPLDRSGNLLL